MGSGGNADDLAACLVGRARPCEITNEGLLAAEKYFREHLAEHDSGTPPGNHRRFIASLLSEALRASHIAFCMPPEPALKATLEAMRCMS